ISSAVIYGGSNLPGAYGSVGFGTAPDTVFGPGGQQQSIKTWGFRGAYTHNWDPYWNTSLYGAYAAVMYNDTAKSLICGVGGVGGTFRAAFAGGAGVTSCNPDYNIGQLGLITRWTPVKNLTFSADVTYVHLDQKYAGTITTSAGAIGKPVATYELKNQDTVQMLFRAQRNW
ncbi:porin, partial [Kocuria rosea]|uniref:porin n=4 Tax=Bacteria TaxID=2 RepID=UPI000D66E76C